MKPPASSDPHTKDGLAIGTGDGRVGNEWALFRELIVEAMEERREREREPGETSLVSKPFPAFQFCTLKSWEGPGDEAKGKPSSHPTKGWTLCQEVEG